MLCGPDLSAHTTVSTREVGKALWRSDWTRSKWKQRGKRIAWRPVWDAWPFLAPLITNSTYIILTPIISEPRSFLSFQYWQYTETMSTPVTDSCHLRISWMRIDNSGGSVASLSVTQGEQKTLIDIDSVSVELHVLQCSLYNILPVRPVGKLLDWRPNGTELIWTAYSLQPYTKPNMLQALQTHLTALTMKHLSTAALSSFESGSHLPTHCLWCTVFRGLMYGVPDAYSFVDLWRIWWFSTKLGDRLRSMAQTFGSFQPCVGMHVVVGIVVVVFISITNESTTIILHNHSSLNHSASLFIHHSVIQHHYSICSIQHIFYI